MASNYFYYPDATTPTTTLTFTYGHLLDESDLAVEFNESTGRSKGGTRYASSFGANKQVHKFAAIIDVTHGSNTDRADVISFLDTVLGSVNYFTWRDEATTDLVVRIIDGSMTFKMLSGDKCRFSCSLEVQ